MFLKSLSLRNKIIIEFLTSVFIQIMYCFYLSNRVFSVYGINDDVIIKSWLSGDYTGNPEFFVRGQATPRVFFGYIVSSLYRLLPNFEWFSLSLLISVIFSWSIIFILVNRISNTYIRIYSLIVTFIFYSVFFAAYFITPTYTAAAFLPVSSGILLLLYLISNRKINVKFIILINFWIFWGFSIRSESFIFSIASFSVIIVFLVIRFRSQYKHFLLIFMIFISLIASGEVIEKNIYNSNPNWLYYKNFESLRYHIQDNLIEKNLDINPTKAGWTRTEYLIFNDYLYADSIVYTPNKLKFAIDSFKSNNNFDLLSLIKKSTEISKIPLFPWQNVLISLLIFVTTSVFLAPHRILIDYVQRILIVSPIVFSFLYISIYLRLPERVIVSTLYLVFLVYLASLILATKNYDFKEDSNLRAGFIVSILGALIIFSQISVTNNWLVERHKNSFYRDFWELQKNVIHKLPPRSVLIGNQSQIKSDWSNPYLRQDVESSFRILTLGWHTFSPHWDTRRKKLGLQNVNLLREIPFDERIMLIGNDSTIENLTKYIKEKLDIEVRSQIVESLKIGEFEFKLFTFHVT